MNPTALIVAALAAVTAAFHLFAAGVLPFTALVQRPVHLALMGVLAFLGAGITVATGERRSGTFGRMTSALLISGLVFSCAYLVLQHEELVRRSGAATTMDLVAGGIAVVVVLELARRTTGWGLVTVALLSLGYAFAGPYLPGMLAHRGYTPTRVIEHLYLSTEGIWGIPLGVSADFVYLFVLFGAVLEVAGGGALLIALANRITGKTRGGPAKTAVVASGLMGSLSGSAVANVVTTGAFTIPLMKRSGFQPHFAGAVEAAASTGGQFMPPVMGAGAFILATWTGIPYLRVASAALVPAILFYAALFAAVHFTAEKTRIERIEADDADESVSRRLHLLVPLVVIVGLLVAGRSPMRAAFWGVVSATALTLLRSTTRLDGAGALRVVVGAAGATVQVAAACATAGIVVGVVSLTGVGLRMSELIITVAQGHLAVALLLTALGSIVLGMGLPTTAAYVVLAALGAPALVDLGVPVLAAHLFIFYFGCVSNVTPPVALAAYAAAGIAGAPVMRTAVTAMLLSATGFIVPFMFVYGEPLLLTGGALKIIMAVVTATVGVTALAAAIIGHTRRPLAWWERTLLFAAAGSLIFPGLITDTFGLGVVALIAVRGRGA